MAKKLRIQIPDDISDEILFLSDRTCCVCNTRGKSVQTHHIDENPANNLIDNIAVLCFDCHDLTLIKGGFGRKLNANQIIKYRNEWIERVKSRKEKADEIASIQTLTGATQTVMVVETIIEKEDFLNYKTNDDSELLIDYLSKILIVNKAQLIFAQIKWDSGITSTMNQGNSDMIDFYEEVLIELSTFYSKGHFNSKVPKDYFSELIASRFQWYWHVLTPHKDKDTGFVGTMVSTMVGGHVMHDLTQMVVDMVCSLVSNYAFCEKLDFVKWREEWQQ